MTAISQPFPGAGHNHAADHAHDHAHGHEELGFLKKYIFSGDHKVIGIQFLFMGLMFFVIGGLLALVVRWQLAWPNNEAIGLAGVPVPVLAKMMGWSKGVMPPDFYTSAFTMHASIMIFFVIIP